MSKVQNIVIVIGLIFLSFVVFNLYSQGILLGGVDDARLADLEVIKDASPNTGSVGDTIVWTIDVDNNGPSDAQNVILLDILPAAVTFVSASATSGTYDDATGTWTVGTIVAGGSATLTITTTVKTGFGGLITNTATILSSDVTPDSDPSNDSDDGSFTIPDED